MTTNSSFERHNNNDNVWLAQKNAPTLQLTDHGVTPIVLESEAAVGKAMLQELFDTAAAKQGDINIALLGGRGAQELHRLLGELAKSAEHDELLGRLNVFTQDALGPMSMANSFSFVRDFERIFGEAFFKKIKEGFPLGCEGTAVVQDLQDQVS